jgi:hypothetical protein
MKKIITTAFATMVAVYGYAQDGIHLPLTGGTLSGDLSISKSNPYMSLVSPGIRDWHIGQFHGNGDLTFRAKGSPDFDALKITPSGALTGTSATFSGDVWSNMTPGGTWANRMGVRNVAGDKSSFVGVYSDKAVVGAHNHALNAWADLYINTVTGSDGGAVRFGNTIYGTSATFSESINLSSSNTDIFWTATGNKVGIRAWDGNVRFYTGEGAYTEAMTIDNSQNINLNGSLTGTSATFSNNLNINSTLKFGGWNAMSYSGNALNIGGVSAGQWSDLRLYTNDILRYNVDGAGNHDFKSGAATFGGALTGTSATFSSDIIATTGTFNLGTGVTGTAINITGAGGGTSRAKIRFDSDWTTFESTTNRVALFDYTGTGISINGGAISLGGALTGTAANFTNNVGIGSTQANANLYVHGVIKSKEVKVEATVSVPDYVFEKSYDLKSLAEVEKYITENKHLPEIPSAKVIEKEGINVGEMQLGLLKKIEELTLYMIEQNKLIRQQDKRIEQLERSRSK